MASHLNSTIVALSLSLTASCGGGASETRALLHFTDVTAESDLHMTPICGNDPPSTLLEMKGSGLALVDYDADGDPDVFVPNGATLDEPYAGPGCRLFENLGGMRFRDVTEAAGLTMNHWGFGTAVGDFDGDGFEDIHVSCFGKNVLLRNTGAGGFEDVSAQAGIEGEGWSSASCFGDVDGDGDLDLYVVNYVEFDPANPPPPVIFVGVKVFAGPMGLPALNDVLYENQGDGTFKDVSASSGIGAAPASWGLGCVIMDFDADGRADIFVGNDSQPNFLFRGLGEGRFEEMGLRSGIALDSNGAGQATMGIGVGDVDANGLPDLYTSNFMYDNNTLHSNLGNMVFSDRTLTFGLLGAARPLLGWATFFADFDNDADEDLIAFNGHIYPEQTCRENNWDYFQPALLYQREGERFQQIAADGSAGEWLSEKHSDRSAVLGDLDADGDLDIIVSERNGPLRVLRNDRDGGNWLVVSLEDSRPGRDRRGRGARVEMRTAAGSQFRWIVGGVGFLSSNEPIAHFGVPEGTEEVEVRVTWSDGTEQVASAVPTRARFVMERK